MNLNPLTAVDAFCVKTSKLVYALLWTQYTVYRKVGDGSVWRVFKTKVVLCWPCTQKNCNNFLITQWISKFQSSLNSLHQSGSADTIIAAVTPTVQDLAVLPIC